MSVGWRWESREEFGWVAVLVADDAPYSRRMETHAHAAIRKTADGRYFYRLSSTMNEEDEPKTYSALADFQHACETELKIRQMEEVLDGAVLA